jgi:hypothetical protein
MQASQVLIDPELSDLKLDLLASCAIIDDKMEYAKKSENTSTLSSFIKYTYGNELRYKKYRFQANLEFRKIKQTVEQLTAKVKKFSDLNTKLYLQNELLELQNSQLKTSNEHFTSIIRGLQSEILQLKFEIFKLQKEIENKN